jgi:hypothetical protein
MDTNPIDRDARGGATMGAAAAFAIWLLASFALGQPSTESGLPVFLVFGGAILVATTVYAVFYSLLVRDFERTAALEATPTLYDWAREGV